MSGESPREEKLVVRHGGTSDEPGDKADDAGAIGMTARPISRQQLTVCVPVGQHGLCGDSE
jgi:hypothetical protein